VKTKEKLYLQCSVLVRQEGDQYASWCPELDVASSGATIEEASKNLNDAIHCFLETYSEFGELPQMLRERGVELVRGEESPRPVFLSGTRIAIPSMESEDSVLVSP
jgi:predicted RNase H-like HicB family nuclease